MISNQEIYERAFFLIDDPDIIRVFMKDKMKFYKIMYPFLINGVSLITRPPQVNSLLAERIEAQGKLEIFQGDGGKEYTLSTTPLEGAIFQARIGSEIDEGAVYNNITNTVEFSEIIPLDEQCSFEWYYAGEFTGDFSKINGQYSLAALESNVKDLLARATVISWAQKEQNFLLDIRNLLNDTDFKVHSPANALHTKIEWVNSLKTELINLQNTVGWNLRLENWGKYGY